MFQCGFEASILGGLQTSADPDARDEVVAPSCNALGPKFTPILACNDIALSAAGYAIHLVAMAREKLDLHVYDQDTHTHVHTCTLAWMLYI